MGTLTDADLVSQTSLTAHYAGTLRSDPGGVISQCQMTAHSGCTAAALFGSLEMPHDQGAFGESVPSVRPRVLLVLDAALANQAGNIKTRSQEGKFNSFARCLKGPLFSILEKQIHYP